MATRTTGAPPITPSDPTSVIKAKQSLQARSRAKTFAGVRRHWQLYAMLAIPLVWLIVFMYIPMYGAQIAFRDYSPVLGTTGSPWVGLKHFERFVHAYNFWPILRNTLVLNLYSLVVGFPIPIILALMLNYVGRNWFKKSVQMVSFAPHFISMVVIVGMLFVFVDPQGFVNQVLGLFGVSPISFMAEPKYWKSLYVWSGVWQSAGFSCIIYLAALAGIDPTLHEAAIVDGATKMQRIRDIDLPGIMPIAVILLILSMGTLLSTGFEKVILMQNNLNKGTSEVIDSYVYNIALNSQVPQFSYATAIGLFKSVIGLILIFGANQIAKRMQGNSLF